jgi:hypothetical protein
MICWFENDSNNIMSGVKYVFFTSTLSSRNSGMYLEKENFRSSIGLYTARRLFALNHHWEKHDDLYQAPKDNK